MSTKDFFAEFDNFTKGHDFTEDYPGTRVIAEYRYGNLPCVVNYCSRTDTLIFKSLFSSVVQKLPGKLECYQMSGQHLFVIADNLCLTRFLYNPVDNSLNFHQVPVKQNACENRMFYLLPIQELSFWVIEKVGEKLLFKSKILINSTTNNSAIEEGQINHLHLWYNKGTDEYRVRFSLEVEADIPKESL